MKIKQFDYRQSREDIFYKVIYPIYAKEFLYGNDYESFCFTIEANFFLNSEQWDYIAQHWAEKERILSIKEA